MKKWMILSALLPLLFFVSCTKKSGERSPSFRLDSQKIKVLSTTAMIGDLVSRIGGEEIQHLVLITGDIDPHSYELVKGDDEKLDSADIVFHNGLGLEHGASLHYRLKNHAHSIALGDLIFRDQKEFFLTVDGEIDPHIWMDVSLWAKAIPHILDALCYSSPENACYYQENAALLTKNLEELDRSLEQRFHAIPKSMRYLVTSHDAFNYFTRRYLAEPGEEGWEERFKAPEGLAPDMQLSLNDLGRIIEHLIHYQIPVVFPECNLSRDALRKISKVCEKKGHRVKIAEDALFGDTMGGAGSGAESYEKMMEHNGRVIAGHLSGRGS